MISIKCSLLIALLYCQIFCGESMVANNKSASTQVTGQVISRLAETALKIRLTKQSGVKVHVDAEPSQLITGSVPYVKVLGRGWASPTGKLTCRRIEASVKDCKLDFKSVLTRQKLVLNKPAIGSAMVALTSEDFGSFLTHPLLHPPRPKPGGEPFKFLDKGVVIDNPKGQVIFFGSYDGEKWQCALSKADQTSSKSIVRVTPVELSSDENDTIRQVELSLLLTTLLSDFFNSLVFELDGTFLTYRDMMVTSKGESPSVLLALDITVKKFPSPGIDF